MSRPSIDATSSLISNRGIINLSNYQPTKNELEYLALGKQCVLPPEPQTLKDIHDQLWDFRNRLLWKIYLDDYDSEPTKMDLLISKSKQTPLAPETNSDVINSYLRKIYRKAKREYTRVQHRPLAKTPARLKQAQKSLRGNHSIVIKPADKNLGITIVNSSWYKLEGERHLTDINTYKPIDKNDLQEYIDNIIKTLLDILDQFKVQKKYIFYLTANISKYRIPRFYLIPKIHKTPVLGRPIVSSINWITTNASKWIDTIFQPFTKRIPTLVQNSVDVIRRLEGKIFPSSMKFLSADVDALYPSIDINDCLQLLKRFCLRERVPDYNFLLRTVEWILKNNIVEFDDSYFLQIKGTAMGTPAAVVIANIYMFELENELLLDSTIPRPLYYFRFIDDLTAGFQTHNDMIKFLQGFNNLRPSTIHLTAQTTNPYSEFLDITLYPTPTIDDHVA